MTPWNPLNHLSRFLEGGLERLNLGPAGGRLARGVFWSLTGGVCSRVLLLTGSVLVTRLLGAKDFGVLSVVQNTAGMFGTLALFGLGVTATKYVAEFRDSDPTKAGRIIVLCSVMSWMTGALAGALLALFAPWVAAGVFGVPEATEQVRIAGLLAVMFSANSAQLGVLSGFEAFKLAAWTGVATSAVGLPCLVLGAWFWSLDGAVWGMVTGSVATTALQYWAVRRTMRRAKVTAPSLFGDWWRERAILWRFSLPVVLCGVATLPASWLSTAILAQTRGGLRELGLYNALHQWRMLVLYFPTQVSNGLAPVLAHLHGQGDRLQIRRLLRQALGWATAPAAVAAAGILVMSPWILQLYGDEFRGLTALLGLLMLLGILGAVSLVLQSALNALGKSWWLFWAMLLYGASVLCFTWLQAHWGAVGFALAQLEAALLFFGLLACLLGWRALAAGPRSCGVTVLASATGNGGPSIP